MKILHVLASNKYSGAENVVCQIIDMFKQDAEMAYCSPNGDIGNTLKRKDVNFLPLKKFSLKELKKAVKYFDPDIIHAHDLKAIALVSLLNKRYKKIAHVHVNDKDKMGKLSIKSFLLKFVSKKFSHIFWVSKSCFEDYKYKTAIQNKSSILYNIINTEKFNQLASEDSNNYDYDIVYVGRLAYQKNPLRLLEIAKQLKSNGQKFKFAIIGSGDKEQEMKEFIANNNLNDCVSMLGFLSNGYKILSQAKLMLMTSLFEGTPMCALEALSLGTPIITTKTDGMVDLIKDNYNGFLYDSNDEAVSKISSILNDNNLYKSLSKNAIDFSKDYNNLEKYKQTILQIYNNTLKD